MTIPAWQPGTTYQPGALVLPLTEAAPLVTDLNNPSFSDGTGWDLDAALSIVSDTGGYNNTGRVQCVSTATDAIALNTARIGINAGQTMKVAAMLAHATGDKYSSDGALLIKWYASDDTLISQSSGTGLPSLSNSGWQQITLSAVAPALVSYCRIGVGMRRSGSDLVQASFFRLNYTPQPPTRATMYKATQSAAGKSGSTEPAWPALGAAVTDGAVTWLGVNIDRIVWQASPLFKTDGTEPTWPTAPGTVVHDGTIDWVATVPYITDENCPNTPVVAIMASKVFAADKDIVRFCATANANDWTAKLDAGYLPTGLQQANANDMAVLAPYRGNLTAFNASSFQNWQVDPDPAAMALLDQMEGIGSTAPYAAQPVGNELFYLSQLGVRSVSIAAGADNLEAGDVGMPVDSIIQSWMSALPAGTKPRAMYYPSAGQYWVAFPGDTTDVGVFTMNGGKGKWSRYTFPFSVDAFAQLGNDAYIRHGDVVSKVVEGTNTDDVAGVATNFAGVVWWPWLDFGSPGVTKMLAAVDVVASGNPEISIGYDQTNTSAFTPPYALGPDTMTGGMIAMPVAGPTLSVKLSFAGGEAWSVQAVQLYLQDTRGQP